MFGRMFHKKISLACFLEFVVSLVTYSRTKMRFELSLNKSQPSSSGSGRFSYTPTSTALTQALGDKTGCVRPIPWNPLIRLHIHAHSFKIVVFTSHNPEVCLNGGKCKSIVQVLVLACTHPYIDQWTSHVCCIHAYTAYKYVCV